MARGRDAGAGRGARCGPDGLAVEGDRPEPIAWQEPELTWKPRTIALTFAKDDGAGLRADAEPVYGTFTSGQRRHGCLGRRARRPAATRRRDPRRAAHGRAPSPDHRRPGARAVPGRGRGARRAVPRRRRPPRRGRRSRGHLRPQPEHQLHERLLRRMPVLRVRAARGRRRSPTPSRSARSPTAPRRRGSPARPRSACKAGSIPTCPAPSTPT